MYDLVVFYTFDAPTDASNFNLKMLKWSINSILREFTTISIKIMVYTNLTEELEKILDKCQVRRIPVEFANIVKSANYPPIFENSYYRHINNNYGAAHGRVYIMQDLLQEYDCPILYIDSDVAIAKGKGPEIIEYLRGVETVLTDAISATDFRKDFLEENTFTTEVPEWIPDCNRFCAGVLFIKNCDLGVKLSKTFREKYIKISREFGFTESNDEYAVALAFHELGVYPTHMQQWYIPNRNCPYPQQLKGADNIVHYALQKYYHKEFVENWLDGNTTGEAPPYKDVDEYVWGRIQDT